MTQTDDRGVVELRKAGEVERVVDGEVVDKGRQTLIGRIVRRPPAHLVTSMGKAGPVAATKRATRRGVRHSWIAGQGGVNWVRRAQNAVTHGVLREQVRLARLAGDKAALAEWVDRLEEAKDRRVQRLVNFPKAALGVLTAVATMIVGTGLILLFIGILFAIADGGLGWSDWWELVGASIRGISGAVQILMTVAAWVLPVLLIVAAWREGRRVANPPMWLLTADERAKAGSEVTTETITAALAHLKIPELSKALKNGAVLEFLIAPREQGGGTYFQVRLPLGCVAASILPSAKVELLAGNLSRHRHEMWPQRQPLADARVLDCWAADKGTMDKPAPPWPLLDGGTFDVFRDRLPWGVTMRGDQVAIGMLQKHWLIGGTSKQGKTSALRTLLLGLALDVTVEFRLADLKGDGDFAMLEPRCHTYISGQADEHAEAAVVMLEDALEEMQRRYDEKTAKGITLTRQVSRQPGSGFHPIWVVVDECQVMYAAGKSADGKTLLGGSKDESRALKAAKRLHDQARAVNIHLIQATQRPDDRTLPVRVREGAHVRASLYVPNLAAAKMILADAAERGARPYDLRPGRDAGTVVVAGEVEDIPLGQAFAIVRTHYLPLDDARAVATRAIELWRKAGRDKTQQIESAPEAEIDHLANIEEALRDEPRVRTAVVLGRLIELNQTVYEPWSFQDLAAALREHDIEVGKYNGDSVVRLKDVSEAMERRENDLP